MAEPIGPTELVEAMAFCNVVREVYGYDFTEYARSSQLRRLRHIAQQFSCSSISQLQHKILHEPPIFTEFLSAFNISVTDYFRDAAAFLSIQQEVLPFLATFSRFKVWHAGCASGDELYSMAILLGHKGLLERSRLYGTDISPEALQACRDGITRHERIKAAEERYAALGYSEPLSSHFTTKYDGSLIHARYRDRAVFADHNLATDSSFGTFQFICCRNVLIYFGQTLQERAIELLRDSLCNGGYLCLGSRESLTHRQLEGQFECVDWPARLYRRQGGMER